MKWKMLNKMVNDNNAYVWLIVGIVGAIILVIFMGMIWWTLSNLQTVGIGFLYIALGISMMIATGALMMMAYKKYIASGGD